MGLVDSLKDAYYKAEEKYYGVLDRIDEVVPIYKVIDPIDSIVPSFILVLLIAAVILVLILGMIGSALFVPTTSTLEVTVKDADKNPLSGVEVKYVVLGEEVKKENTNAQGVSVLENIEKDTEVLVEAGKEGFLTEVTSVIITELPIQLLQITLEEESVAVLTKTIRIVDSLGASIAKDFTLSFRCSSPYATPPADIYLTPADNGVAQVTVPTNCETLVVSVTDDVDFADVTSFEIFPEETDVRIQLQEVAVERGAINVLLKSEGEFVEESIEVQLFRFEELLINPESGPVDFDFSSGGRASFSVPAGSYVVKTVASTTYGAQTSSKITIGAGEEEEVTLELVAEIAGEIKIQVVDEDSNDPIDDAKVTLKFQSDDTVVATKETDIDEDAIVVFNITRDVTYRVVVEADGYQLGKRESLRISDSVYRIELEPCTPTTCGELRVKVLDQDAKPVENATVALYNADTDFLAGYSNQISDANGEVEFAGVASGNYYAFAFKESIAGRSDSVFFSSSAQPTDEFHLTVTMIVPKGIVKAIIKDKDNRPIPFPIVSVYDARTDELLGSSFGDTNGVFEFETKADKRIYFKIRQKDTTPKFADYITVAIPVLPQTVQTFNVTLEPEIIDKDIEIEFLGLFVEEKSATTLSKGDEYVAKFKLRIPEEKDYSETGVHIRTGSALIMEKDPLFIKEVNAPQTSQIRATRFDEKSGLDEWDHDLTNSDAKWVNLAWNEPEAGIYEIEAVVQVKETASIRDELKVFWRAWAQNGVRERHPPDDTITQELYSEAFSRIFEVGVTTLCDSQFCFSARIRDMEEALTESVVDSYSARMLSEYELKFTILNNSEFRVHDKANLRVKNEDETLFFTDYRILDAQTRETSGTLGGSEFERFEVGELRPKNKVDFTTKFLTQKAQEGVINIRLVSDEQIVFEKNIQIIVGATKQMELRIQPSIFPSGIETDINVLVLDAQTEPKLEIEDALVKLKDKHDNVLQTDLTGKDGYAFLTLPAQLPGTKLFIEAQKPEYETATAEIEIEGNLIEINPDQLGIALNTKTKHSAIEKFSITNLTPFPLKVSSILFRGDFKNLIDREATQAALDVSYGNFVIEEGKTNEFEVKVFLTEEGKSLDSREDLEASLDITVSNFGKTWSYSLPVKIAIDLEGAVDDPTCLQISRTNWVDITEGDPVRMELRIENNCVIEGNPIELKKLKAQIQWESNQLGIFDIAIGENKTELRSGYGKTLLTRLEPEQSLFAIITFTPFGRVNGEAVGKIKIVASNPQETDEQLLEQEIDVKITVVNLVQCTSIEPVLIEIHGEKESEQKNSFNINVGVGNVSCGGGVDFELESELDVAPKSGRIEDGATQVIEVFRGDAIQGQYPVFVKAKFANQQAEQLIGTVRVRITEEGCIQLSRYEYDVYDNPDLEFDGFDTGTVTNKCFDKPVPITVNIRSFEDAMKFGSTIGLIVFGVSMLGKTLGSLFGAPPDTPGAPGVDYLTEQQIIAKHGAGGLIKDESVGKNIYRVIGSDPAVYYRRDGDKYHPYVKQKEPAKKEDKKEDDKTTETRTEESAKTSPLDNSLLVIPTATGLQLFGGGGGGAGGGFGGGGGLFGGGGIFGMGSNIIDGILGKGDPVTQGLQAFLLATMIDYFSQEKDARFVTIQRDVEIQGVEISNPGEDQARSDPASRFFSSRLVTELIAKKVPDKMQKYLPFLTGGTGIFNIFTGGDEDIEVEQELRDTMKAMPLTGMPPQMISTLFGDREDFTLPALALSTNPEATNQKIEKRGLIFRNKSGFTTTEDEPLYKILRVMAIRHEYKSNRKYERDDCDVENERGWFDFDFGDPIIDPATCEIEELPSQQVDELFHLEFNAVPPEEPGTYFPGLLNCQDGFRVGSTGASALPKVKFDWSWNSITENECDTENENGVFCDATQFSISVLQKINKISEWVQANGPSLRCPSPLDAYANTAVISDFDIGITKAAVSRGGNDAVVRITVENKNPGEVETELKVELLSAASGEIVSGYECSDTLTVLSEEVLECEYNNLEEGNYIVEATITPTVECEDCQDNSESNFLNINFTIGDIGIEECEPYSTARLSEFVAASDESVTGGAEEILSKIKFRANLIEDRYSRDFQQDFDLFAKTKSFFDAPDYYNDEQRGLGLLFRDTELFNFRATFSETNPEGYKLPDAGIYNVVIDITYDDSSWTLFDEDGTNAKVSVLLEKADTPRPDSPFYNLPFNGVIGEDGRVNYGLNYRGENIMINNDPDALVRTIEISGSSAVSDLTADLVDDFKTINTDERGMVMRVVGGASPKLTFAPGFATPVILRITNEFEEAYAFYSVEVDGAGTGAENTGPYMTRWNGVGFNCKAFDDRPMPEFFFTADTHGMGDLDCAIVEGQVQTTSYGFEFCEPKKFGNVYLKTVFYTPQGHQSLLKLNIAQEDASFISPATEGPIVPLDHIILGKEIHSVEDIFDLVKAEYVCVSKEESKTEFWWNPKKIFELMDDKESKLINNCIEE